MNKGKNIFTQKLSHINEYEFKKCVDLYHYNRHPIKFDCRVQFLVMSFAQFIGLLWTTGIEDDDSPTFPRLIPNKWTEQTNSFSLGTIWANLDKLVSK